MGSSCNGMKHCDGLFELLLDVVQDAQVVPVPALGDHGIVEGFDSAVRHGFTAHRGLQYFE
jgi:hypothetical protein